MFKVEIQDRESGRSWEEEYESYAIYRKRIIKLRHSKKLRLLSHDPLLD